MRDVIAVTRDTLGVARREPIAAPGFQMRMSANAVAADAPGS